MTIPLLLLGQWTHKLSNINPYKVNQPIADLIVLSDISGSGGVSVEDDCEPSNLRYIKGTWDSFTWDEGMIT